MKFRKKPDEVYNAVLSCLCGYSEKLSDKDYEEIITERKEIILKCGHWKYGAKIRARHTINTKDWRFVLGSSDKEVTP